MRAREGSFQLGTTLPIVPPPEEDELISSWLDRTARFYGRPLAALLEPGPGRGRSIDVDAIDLGLPPRVLAPVALLLDTSVERLRERVVASEYPPTINLAALVAAPRGSPFGPRLQYAACPHCLEEQRATRGFSWLRREWVLAPRTVCAVHHAALVEMGGGPAVHPAWSRFFGQHRAASPAIFGRVPSADAEPETTLEALPRSPRDKLFSAVAGIESAILANAARTAAGASANSSGGLPGIVCDLVWAFTRVDALSGGRLVYDAFASDALDNPWHAARRHAEGPLEFSHLSLRLRHLMHATATALAGPAALRSLVFGSSTSPADDVAAIHRALQPRDRAEFSARRAGWEGGIGH